MKPLLKRHEITSPNCAYDPHREVTICRRGILSICLKSTDYTNVGKVKEAVTKLVYLVLLLPTQLGPDLILRYFKNW